MRTFRKMEIGTASLAKKYTNNYEQMTNEFADQMATDFPAIEQQRNEPKRSISGN